MATVEFISPRTLAPGPDGWAEFPSPHTLPSSRGYCPHCCAQPSFFKQLGLLHEGCICRFRDTETKVRTRQGWFLVVDGKPVERLPDFAPTPKEYRRQEEWHPLPRPHIESRYPCATCGCCFDDADRLFEHLLDGCWDYDRIRTVPVMANDISVELKIARSWSRALAGDDHARNIIIVSMAAMLRKVCGQTADRNLTRKQFIGRAKRGKEFDWEGDRFSIGMVAVMTEIERWSREGCPPNVRFDDPRQRDTSESLRELKRKLKEEKAIEKGERLKNPFEFLANCAKRDYGHVENGWCDKINGKYEHFGGDFTHGVSGVPREKKGKDAIGDSEQAKFPLPGDLIEVWTRDVGIGFNAQTHKPVAFLRPIFTRHNRPLAECDRESVAGVTRYEITDGELRLSRTHGLHYREETTSHMDFDACIQFDCAKDDPDSDKVTGHGRFVRSWHWLTVLMAVEEGILDQKGCLRFDVWLNENVNDLKNRELLKLMAEAPFGNGLSQAAAGKRLGLTVSQVKTRLKRLIPRICEKLRFGKEVAELILAGNKKKIAKSDPGRQINWVRACVGDALRTIQSVSRPATVAFRSAA